MRLALNISEIESQLTTYYNELQAPTIHLYCNTLKFNDLQTQKLFTLFGLDDV